MDESDRMGHLLGVVDQEKLDEQRGVVKMKRDLVKIDRMAKQEKDFLRQLIQKDTHIHGQL